MNSLLILKDFNVDALEKFVEESSIPIVTLFNKDPSNHPFVVKYFDSPLSKAMLFMNFSSENADSIRTKYQELAGQHKGDGLVFLLGDMEASQGALQYFGLREDQVPLVVIQTTDGQKYLKANLESDQIAPWLKEYKEGKVPAFKKSEPIPEVNDEPVKVVVADSLGELVTNSGKNVLLEFYAPWCGHCQKLAPILEEVAISYQSDADVLIAKLDATANDIPSDTYDVKGFPTIFFRSATGKLVQYEGDRTKQDMIDFIEKNRDKIGQQEPAAAAADKEEEPAKDEL
ncbi:PROTEIN DISULFIDE-ISOMERASE [Salix koriyanagi]|uniref:protein disulfide-isomerase n=1 Tax=Salix koriyanagi TaxID=2511006 RepID=A0A9Q0YRQ2_9ROSI|nr:PROTEIN DISULFIDE-ISOMERASE [Salix koriyanagi]